MPNKDPYNEPSPQPRQPQDATKPHQPGDAQKQQRQADRDKDGKVNEDKR